MQGRAGSAPFGYRFSRSPPSRLGRNDLVASDNLFVPAARFLRPGFAFFASLTPIEGWRSAERRTGACEAPVGLLRLQARRFGGALRPITRDARLSALSPWRFWAPVPRLPHRHLRRIGYSELLASGSYSPPRAFPSLPAHPLPVATPRPPPPP